MTDLPAAFLTAAKDALGPKGWSEETSDLDAAASPWRGTYQGHTPFLAKPASTEEGDKPRASRNATADASGRPSIAVLPFVNLSEVAGMGYFGDGLAEEILNLLAKLDELSVAARTSSFYFKEICRELAFCS